jgi:hypothetical protein
MLSSLWDIPTMIVTMDSKRRLTIPAACRGIRGLPGGMHDAERENGGRDRDRAR